MDYAQIMDKEFQDGVRKRLVAYMHQHALSLRHMADVIKVARPTITSFITQKRTISFTALAKIEKYLNEQEQLKKEQS